MSTSELASEIDVVFMHGRLRGRLHAQGMQLIAWGSSWRVIDRSTCKEIASAPTLSEIELFAKTTPQSTR